MKRNHAPPIYTAFRTPPEELVRAGFTVISLYGDWDASPIMPTSPELILTAAKAP